MTGRDQSGSVTLWVVLSVPALFAGVGLVVDGGAAMAAKGRAISVAYQAARAGAEQLDLPTYATTGAVVIDPAAARQAAAAYLASAGIRPTAINVDGDQVSVAVEVSSPNRLLDLFGMNTITVSAQGSATATYGIRSAGG